jgi:hypothetical protein
VCARGGGGRAGGGIRQKQQTHEKRQTRQLGLRALLLDVLVDEGGGVGEVRVALRSRSFDVFDFWEFWEYLRFCLEKLVSAVFSFQGNGSTRRRRKRPVCESATRQVPGVALAEEHLRAARARGRG